MTYPCPWIPETCPPLQAAIAREAHRRIGILEEGGANRGPEIDEWLKEAGCPPGLPWCAAFVSKCFRLAGAAVPPLGNGTGPASCDEWVRWAKAHGLWRPKEAPDIGYAVIYGKGEDAQHIGVVVRRQPLLCAVEGNTSVDNSPQREGLAVDFKPVNLGWALGYIRPAAAPLP